MRIVLKEMKKILNLKAILLLAVFTLLYFVLFLDTVTRAYDREYYNNNLGPKYDLYRELVKKAGPTLSSDEMSLLDSIEEEQYRILDAAVQEYDVLKNEGISSFDDLKLKRDDDTKYMELYAEIVYSREDTGMAEQCLLHIQGLRSLRIGLSEQEVEELFKYGWTDYSELYLEKQKELWMKDEISLVPVEIVEDSFRELGYIATWITICCMIIVLPYRVKENFSGVKLVGVSAKEGRNLYLKQWLAAMLSSILTALVQLILYAFCLYKTGFLSFWLCPNCSTSLCYWFDMSYGTHLLVYAILIMLFAAIAGTVFFLVSGVNSYMRAVSFGVPCCVALAFVAWMIFDNLFSIPEVVFLKLSELYVIGLLLIIVSPILYLGINKNKSEDVKEEL